MQTSQDFYKTFANLYKQVTHTLQDFFPTKTIQHFTTLYKHKYKNFTNYKNFTIFKNTFKHLHLLQNSKKLYNTLHNTTKRTKTLQND